MSVISRRSGVAYTMNAEAAAIPPAASALELHDSVAKNVGNMRRDRNLFRRAVTILVLGPLAVFLATFHQLTCLVLVSIVTLGCLYEWANVKRHVKVVAMASLGQRGTTTRGSVHLLDREYPIPVPTRRMADMVKCALGFVITGSACIGPGAMYNAQGLLYFYVICRTMVGVWRWGSADAAEAKRCTDNPHREAHASGGTGAAMDGPTLSRADVERFEAVEAALSSQHVLSEVFLDVLLELFGFMWISGISYPLITYDSRNVVFAINASSFVANFFNDIFALVVGRSLKGRTRPLFPRVSPNKSLEGALAGVLMNMFVVTLWLIIATDANQLCGIPPWLFGVVTGFLYGCVGVLGDLLQSLIKRAACIKDTGALLPGHGGILDRVDGLLLVLPVTYWITCALNYFVEIQERQQLLLLQLH